jgi:hypothetical protein
MPKVADDIRELQMAVTELSRRLKSERRLVRWILFILLSGLIAAWIRG